MDQDAIYFQLTASCPLGLIEGGTISGVNAAGGSLPDCFRFINHIARANCSGFNLPSCFISHKFLKVSLDIVLLTREHLKNPQANHISVKAVISIISYQIWARMFCGSPVCRKTFLISTPDTNPSWSESVCLKRTLYRNLSPAFTTQGTA